MSTVTRPSTLKNKHFILNQTRLKMAQKVLGARTETETIETALERVISESERNKSAWSAQTRFINAARKHDLIIKDVFCRLEDK